MGIIWFYKRWIGIMRNNNVVNCVRYGHSLEEIELEPDPKETHFDGSEKVFNVVIKMIFVE
jgi:hypothetical protein